MEFLNLWYVMICTNDCLIIMGSVIKGLIETRSIVGDMWDICRYVAILINTFQAWVVMFQLAAILSSTLVNVTYFYYCLTPLAFKLIP